MASAQALAKVSQDLGVRLFVTNTFARNHALSDAEARSMLVALALEAERAGFVSAALEARLRAGQITGARAEILTVENEARSRGLVLLAKKAAALRR
jgi:hypothetical protein